MNATTHSVPRSESAGRPADIPRGPARTRGRRVDWRSWGAFALLTAPMLIGLGLFKYIAIGWSLLLSLSDAQGTIALGDWVGLDNYRQLLGSAVFRTSLVEILLFTVIIVPITFAASLGLALHVHRIRPGRAVQRTALLIPAAVSKVAAT
ncbi:carbohydrate ABC transporter permease, partial [Streptomyces sp. NPDC055721]